MAVTPEYRDWVIDALNAPGALAALEEEAATAAEAIAQVQVKAWRRAYDVARTHFREEADFPGPRTMASTILTSMDLVAPFRARA